MFRESGRVGDRVLDELAGTEPSTPDQTGRLQDTWKQVRIARSLNAPSDGQLLVAIAIGLLVSTVIELPLLVRQHEVFLKIFGVVTILLYVLLLGYALKRRKLLRATRAARLGEVTAWPARQPFPVTGFASWLVADVPLLDLHAPAPIDTEKLSRAIRNIDASIETETIDDQTVRIKIPPLLQYQKYGPFPFGNLPLLDRLFTELVLPLHADGAVQNVSMGGLVK
ncbi:MAG TPA: hypothetical protein VGC41_28975 [Kofleriaceae bacterium]